MKKRLLLILCCALVLAGCGAKEEPKTPEETPKTPAEAPEEVDPYEGMARNPLTGLYIGEEVAARRPIAVMINNLHKALPQSGIAEADILYECLAEGEITRLVAVFQDFTGEKIGPVRSARSYYTYFALDHDALYIHHGGSETGYDAIANRKVDHLDGMHDTTAFWRDKTRMNTAGMYEHSSYISAEGVLKSWENSGYRMTEDPGYHGMFSFHEEDTPLTSGTVAESVEIPYSSYQIGQFYYDAAEKEYERYQSGNPHIDDVTGETLRTKNILIQFADMRVVDNEGRRDVDLVGSGAGYYITDGTCMGITWQKDSYGAPTQWFDDAGNALVLNPGKTWVCVCQTGSTVTIQ